MSASRLAELALAQVLAESGTQTLTEARDYLYDANNRLTGREERALRVHIELGEFLILEASSILADSTDEIAETRPIAYG